MDEDSLRRALETAGLTAPVRWDDVTASTNETAMAMASEGAPAWTVVAAGHQTRGRGRRGRTWVDGPGRALLCSVVLRPSWDPERLGLLSLAAGAAMASAIEAVAGRAVRCKWPNDLLDGRSKVGGILGESEVANGSIRHVVIGVGVNLGSPPDVPGAGAVGDVDGAVLLAGFLERLRHLVDRAPDEIRERYRSVSDTIGRRVEAATASGEIALGVAADVDDTGALVVETEDGPVRVAFGDVLHLREPAE